MTATHNKRVAFLVNRTAVYEPYYAFLLFHRLRNSHKGV